MLLKIKNQALALTIYVALATYGLIAAMIEFSISIWGEGEFLADIGAAKFVLYLLLQTVGLGAHAPIFFDQEPNISLCRD